MFERGIIQRNELNDLILRAQNGDIESFDTIAHTYSWIVEKNVIKYLSLGYEFNDLFCIGYQGIHSAIRNFDPEKCRFELFANMCVYRRIVDFLLKHNEDDIELENLNYEDTISDESIEDIIIDKSIYNLIRDVVFSSKEDMSLVIRSYYNNESISSIAKDLGISRQSCYIKLRRKYKIIKKEILDRKIITKEEYRHIRRMQRKNGK